MSNSRPMKADEKLENLGIEYEEVVQDEPTKSCDDAAKERGLNTNQIVKSLIIESEREKYHVLLPGDRTLSESKLGAEYRMVPPEEAEEATGFEPGTVHPFSTELKHVVDERILEKDLVSHTVGEKTRGIITESQNFRKGLEKSEFEVTIRDIAVSTEEDFQEVEDQGLGEEDAKFIVNKGYRKDFLNLIDIYSSENILTALKELERNETTFTSKEIEEVLERAENQTHIQKLVEHLSENGELPEESDFDLQKKVDEVIEENPDAVEDYRNGQDSAVNYLIGELMQETNGKANAGESREKLLEALK